MNSRESRCVRFPDFARSATSVVHACLEMRIEMDGVSRDIKMEIVVTPAFPVYFSNHFICYSDLGTRI